MKIVLEEKAEESTCPFGMAHQAVTIRCEGSRCMAWVWDIRDNPEFSTLEFERARAAGKVYDVQSSLCFLIGHCGMVDRRQFRVDRNGTAAIADGDLYHDKKPEEV